jgi:predicted NAD/FAD-binding protein
MRIAIIGSGISGLTAAYFLHPVHEVTLFEAHDAPGGHTHTVNIELDHRLYAVDTGFIVYNQRNYPCFVRILNELGVATQATSMSFSVRCDQTGLEYRGGDWRGLFAQRRNLLRPTFHHMLLDIVRFNRCAQDLLAQPDTGQTVDEFLGSAGFSAAFRDYYFYPMGSAIWSCARKQFADFPLRFVLEFFQNHGLLSLRDRPQWRVIRGGSRNYVRRMIQGFRDRIRTGTAIRSVSREAAGQHVAALSGDVGTFDHVLFACHSDQALAILGADASSLERSVLSSFPYEENEAILHTDISVLPTRRSAWASWNYRLPRVEQGRACVSYNMNILQGLAARKTVCVTLNPWKAIDPSKVLRRLRYAHPVFGARRMAARQAFDALHNQPGRSYCGAYWGNGFHEDGVVSALRVCQRLLDRESWKAVSTRVGFNTFDESPRDTSFATTCV